MAADRPRVVLSYAQSADGRIATAEGSSQWISGLESLEFSHRLRRDNEVIIVGIGTVLKDDPLLTCRLEEESRSPVRVVFDSRLRIPLDSKIVHSAKEHRSIVFAAGPAPAENDRAAALIHAGVEVEWIPPAADGRVDPEAALLRLGELGFRSVYLEGGAALITSFFGRNLVDRLYLVTAPMIIGRGIEAVGDLGIRDLDRAPRGSTVSLNRAGQDVIWEISFEENTAAALRERPELHEEKARVLYFTGAKRVELRKEEVRRQTGEELVRSKVIGISAGTERHYWEGSFPRGTNEDGLAATAQATEYPLCYGYMNAGETESGERVFAFASHRDLFSAGSQILIPFPPETDYEDIVLYPSVETAYTVAVDAAVLPGERVLIIGQGVIGLLTAEILRPVCGNNLVTIEASPKRAEYSRDSGFYCLSPDPELSEELRGQLGGPADKIINLSGSGEGLQTGIDNAAFGAVIIEASWYGTTGIRLHLGENFHRRRLSIRSSQVSTLPEGLRARWDTDRRTEEARRLTCSLKPSRLISHRYPLAEAQRAFEEIYDGRGEILQAVLLP